MKIEKLSQSLIHQVCYSDSRVRREVTIRQECRNPLFIRSAIRTLTQGPRICKNHLVAIPYSSGLLFGHNVGFDDSFLRMFCRNPLFIRSAIRTGRDGGRYDASQLVAIPYSSGLLFGPWLQRFENRHGGSVAIPYSSGLLFGHEKWLMERLQGSQSLIHQVCYSDP